MSQKIVNVDGNEHDLVSVGHSWLASAFDVAIGGSTSEVCQRFSEDLRALLIAHREPASNVALSDAEFVDQVQAIQWRLSVAAEWALRLEKAEAAQ